MMNLEHKILALIAELELIKNDKLRVSWFSIGGQFGCAVQSTKYQDGIIASHGFTYEKIESSDIESLRLDMSTSLKKDIKSEYEGFMRSSVDARYYPREQKRSEIIPNYDYNPPDSPLMREIHADTQFYGREAAMQMQGLDDRDFEFWG